MDNESPVREPVSEQKYEQESAPVAADAPAADSSSASANASQPATASTPTETDGKAEQPAQPAPEHGAKTPRGPEDRPFNVAPEWNNIIDNYMPNHDSPYTMRPFSIDDGWPISYEKESEITRLFIADPSEIETMLSVLADKRILVISGESETGKATTAIYLGKQLAEADLPEIEWSTYLVPPLGRQIRLDLRALCADAKVFDKRLVIFEDVLVHGNQDILSFFARVERGITDLSISLRKNHAFLIFTVRPLELRTFQRGLVENGLFHRLGELSLTLLEQGFTKRLEFLGERQPLDKTKLETLQAEPQLVIDAFKTMPRIARFVDYYVREPTVEATMSLADAIQRFKDISYWFLKLAQDFDAWCFVLSLCLTQYGSETRATPWMQFVSLWRLLGQCLRDGLDNFPAASQSEVVLRRKPTRTNPALTDDHFFLEKCRAEIVKDPSSLADTVRFRDASYAPELWRILLGHHRRVLTVLLPYLREIVEDRAVSETLRLRALAAQIIGRVGEIDPENIIFETMNRWIETSDKRLRVHVGHLYRGALSSTDERYHALCLRRLTSLATSPDGSEGAKDQVTEGRDDALSHPAPPDNGADEKDRLLTAKATYVQVGRFDLHLPWAMHELGQVAFRHLAGVLDETHRIERLLDRVERAFNQPLYFDDALGLFFTHTLLRDLAYRLYSNNGGIFLGMQLALVSLCRTVDPVRVCQELRTWAIASQTMGALVALMFLQDQGIAWHLEVTRQPATQAEAASAKSNSLSNGQRSTAESAPEDRSKAPGLPPRDESPRRNLIVLSLASGNEAVGQMARFLAAMYESFSTPFVLPGRLQRFLQLSFRQHLKTWVQDALPMENCRIAMDDLFVELLHVRGGSLYEPLYQLLHDKDFARADGELRALADAVLKKY